jgi:hypothetical protein
MDVALGALGVAFLLAGWQLAELASIGIFWQVYMVILPNIVWLGSLM